MISLIASSPSAGMTQSLRARTTQMDETLKLNNKEREFMARDGDVITGEPTQVTWPSNGNSCSQVKVKVRIHKSKR